MEKFVVSARKYRPDTFDTVVGQKSITTTLKNAIGTNHLAHAYLFCGPRGVGKTTCARIFAKTINCLNLQDNTEACNECVSCKSYTESRAFNIHELDAASNNSVDDIRNLIDQIRIPPQVGKYSIYIIDEVHMLSQQAFNAFLKTLEEPPAHAIFILATTEKHKIIPTILSRCQIFDFNRITVEDTVKHLEKIASNENVSVEPDALNIIAQKSEGGLRDALSIFDMLASFTGNNITYQKVIDNLNVLDYNYYFKLTSFFVEGNIVNALLIFDKILKEGFDAHNFINGLSKHFRDLLICKDEQTLVLLEVGNSIKKLYKEQSSRTNSDFLIKALEITNNCDLNYKASKNPRLHVELALIKLCNIIQREKKTLTEDIKPDLNIVQEESPELKKEPPHHTVEQVPKKNTKNEDTSQTFKSENSVSIKDALKKFNNIGNSVVENQNENNDLITEDYSGVPNENLFSQEDLLSYWSEFAEKIKTEMPRSYSTLKSRSPVLKDNFVVELTLINKSQADDINQRVKVDLLSFLREKLNNNLIVFDIIVPEDTMDKGKKPYTAEEKFKYMAGKNPMLNKLKQDFNLDFE